jgi:hypothetical protein
LAQVDVSVLVRVLDVVEIDVYKLSCIGGLVRFMHARLGSDLAARFPLPNMVVGDGTSIKSK